MTRAGLLAAALKRIERDKTKEADKSSDSAQTDFNPDAPAADKKVLDQILEQARR